ncbi:MAG: hypothetical protein WAZ76_06215, partial [Blautia wexlerae]
ARCLKFYGIAAGIMRLQLQKNGESDMGSESEEKKEMLIINGNAFYEIDLECVKKKKQCAQTVHPEKKTDRINSRNMKDKDNIRQHE